MWLPIFIFNFGYQPKLKYQDISGIESLKIEELFEISSIKEEYLLGSPVRLSTSSNGNIFIVDEASMDIKVFDNRGNYLRSIGGRGRGPGEFLYINAFIINEQDQLIISDQYNYRFTFFDTNGNLLSTLNYDKEQISWLRNILTYDNNYLLLFKRDGNLSSTKNLSNDKIFHLTSTHFDTLSQEFGNFKTFDYSEDEFNETNSIISLGDIVKIGKRKIVFAPRLYNGNLYLFQNEVLKIKGTGILIPEKPFTRHFQEPLPNHAIKINGGGRPYAVAATLHSESIGLFRLENGEVIHFSLQQVNEYERKIFVEYFDEKLKLLKKGIIDAFGEIPLIYNHSYIWVAGNYNETFYLIDIRNDQRVIAFKILD